MVEEEKQQVQEEELEESVPVSETEQQQKKIEELTDLLRRKQAEFENYQKRMEQNTIEQSQFATQDFIKKLLPIIDNFHLALEHTSNAEECVQGLKFIDQQLMDVLKNEGIEHKDVTGHQYDASVAQAIDVTEGKKDVIQKVVAKPYFMHGKILRPGKVIVGGKKNE